MFRSLLHALLLVTEIDLCTALVFIAIERLHPSIPEQKSLRRGMLLDVAYVYVATIFGFFVTYAVFTRVLAGVGDWQVIVGLRARAAALPFLAQLAFAVVVTDFTGYWKHRLMHTSWLWPFHAVHHSSEEVDWLSNERVHPVESLLTAAFFAVPLVILGVPLAIVVWTSRIRRFHSVFEHANVKLDYGRGHYLLVSPSFHRWHHAHAAAWMNVNYANIFSAFDWMFGTFKLPTEMPGRKSLGLASFPRGFFGQLLRPFREPRRGACRPR